jgi:hypothetical protein
LSPQLEICIPFDERNIQRNRHYLIVAEHQLCAIVIGGASAKNSGRSKFAWPPLKRRQSTTTMCRSIVSCPPKKEPLSTSCHILDGL